MKTWVIIIGVLAVKTVAVYGFKAEIVQKYNEDTKKCTEEIGGSLTEYRPDILYCVTVRDGEVLNDKYEYKKEKTLERLGDLISDSDKLKQARMIYSKCYDNVVQTGITGKQQTLKIITCLEPMMPLLQ
ncbi:PREDICTED: uncharacterized protein LOC106750853 [Dinoponera quadriceps]|uniref:Uncharacterized protein LOC106750853 n=1 Tax=Dinoponera quadriceps TaxID=609295 RepID=A0A6P3YAA0_DINQU|nr:PREDICTED: uncharacterized protein LOC106750853 [Dinoponera quadriceps]